MPDPFDPSYPTGETLVSELPTLLNNWQADLTSLLTASHDREYGTEVKVNLQGLTIPVAIANISIDTNDGTWHRESENEYYGACYSKTTVIADFPQITSKTELKYVVLVAPFLNQTAFLAVFLSGVFFTPHTHVQLHIYLADLGRITGTIKVLLIGLYPSTLTNVFSLLPSAHPLQFAHPSIPPTITGKDVVIPWRDIRNTARNFLLNQHDAATANHKAFLITPYSSDYSVKAITVTSPFFQEQKFSLGFSDRLVRYTPGLEASLNNKVYSFTFTNLPASGTKLMPVVQWMCFPILPLVRDQAFYRRFRWNITSSADKITVHGAFDGGVGVIYRANSPDPWLVVHQFEAIGVRVLFVQGEL